MKKLIITCLIFISAHGFSQIVKADFENMFSKFKFADMTSIWTKNTRTYYNNGTNGLDQAEYKANLFTYELKENSIYLAYYEDATKTKLSGYWIIPYNKIMRLSVSLKSLTIEFSE